LIFDRDFKPLFDEALNSDGLRRGGIKLDFFQRIGTNLFDLAQLEMRALKKRTAFAANVSHSLFL